MTTKTMTLINDETGEKLTLNVLEPTMGPPTIDIRPLYKKMGFFTFDPGYISTASCSSDITYMDGENGILEYRGYPIEELAKHSSYLETCYLLFHGELPTDTQLADFEENISNHNMVHEALKNFYNGFRRDAHPMAIMMGVSGALSAFYHDHMNVHNPSDRERAMLRLVAKMPTIAAWSFRHAKGLPFIYPDSSLSYSENFLYMMFGVPTRPYVANPVHVKALDLILILHADHEQNASTSTVRLSGSSEANPFAAVSAGVATLWGPAHGGANEAVIRMLKDIIASGKSLEEFVERAKDPDDRFRLMGFGHRVYKAYDPRARIIREICHDILRELPENSPHKTLLDTAMKLEEIALSDDYFKSRNLYPNVDFYSGVIFLAMNIPLNMFTVMFAMARTIGWISQWNEMMGDDESRIGRPRQLYTGEATRSYIDIDKR
ncbi:citrate synthase [Leucothrix mucor]|uniref:citrate synthase n=1 Tax=Leucothrix mucor TaxID=45248 RepID=UPI0003B35365|nr:citrate synthase [Leucothrix mucor]